MMYRKFHRILTVVAGLGVAGSLWHGRTAEACSPAPTCAQVICQPYGETFRGTVVSEIDNGNQATVRLDAALSTTPAMDGASVGDEVTGYGFGDMVGDIVVVRVSDGSASDILPVNDAGFIMCPQYTVDDVTPATHLDDYASVVNRTTCYREIDQRTRREDIDHCDGPGCQATSCVPTLSWLVVVVLGMRYSRRRRLGGREA